MSSSTTPTKRQHQFIKKFEDYELKSVNAEAKGRGFFCHPTSAAVELHYFGLRLVVTKSLTFFLASLAASSSYKNVAPNFTHGSA